MKVISDRLLYTFAMHLRLLALFFLSGMTSLIYQVIWLKRLNLILGAGAYSMAAVLAAFMGGLGLGAFLMGRWSNRIRKPVRLYGLLEGAIAVIALLTPHLFHLVDLLYRHLFQSLGPDSSWLFLLKFFLSFAILFVPTLFMGATLPLLVRFAEEHDLILGRRTGFLYGINTLGAVIGVLAGTFYLIPRFGYGSTLLMAAAGNGLVMVMALVMPWPDVTARSTIREPIPEKWWLAVFFFMGFTSLGYEIFWTRILVFHTGSNVYAFGLMLSSYLLGLAIGSFLMGNFLPKVRDPVRLLILLEAGLGLIILVQMIQFAHFPWMITTLALWTGGDLSNTFLVQFLSCLTAILPPTLIIGATFPLSLHIFGRGSAESGEDVGLLYLSNTAGSIVGSLVAGFVALVYLGTVRSLLLFGLINVLIAMSIAWKMGRRQWAAAACFPILLCLLIIPPTYPFFRASMYHGQEMNILDFHEDEGGTAVLVRRGDQHLALEINGVNVAGTAPDLYVIQKLQGHLPLIIHGKPDSILHIGIGSGGTAHAVSLHSVSSIEIAEISRAVLKLSRERFTSVNHNVFQDPRLSFHLMDGRSLVLATPKKYDCILSDSIHPKYAGNGFLYTEDYFSMLSDRLNDGGVASMWLPMYSLKPKNFKEILKAFHNAFPTTTVWYIPTHFNSFTIIVGVKGRTRITSSTFLEAFNNPVITEALSDTHFPTPEKLLACCILGPDALHDLTRGVSPHRDDRPTVEYESNRIVFRKKTWYLNFKQLLEHSRFPHRTFDLEGIDEEELKKAVRSQGRIMREHLTFLHGKVTREED